MENVGVKIKEHPIEIQMTSEALIQQAEHNNQKPYKCSYYGNNFPFRYHLAVHEIMHTGEKPYQCSDCEKCFTRTCHLENHQRVHTGKKKLNAGIVKRALL